jgi:hypothetical protein
MSTQWKYYTFLIKLVPLLLLWEGKQRNDDHLNIHEELMDLHVAVLRSKPAVAVLPVAHCKTIKAYYSMWDFLGMPVLESSVCHT